VTKAGLARLGRAGRLPKQISSVWGPGRAVLILRSQGPGASRAPDDETLSFSLSAAPRPGVGISLVRGAE
jgi:hypothetical protein